MTPIASAFILLGAAIALLAGIGLVRFQTSYARFHAAGKASPIAFFLVSIGAAFELGVIGALELLVAAVALLLTLPASTHLLFRSTHRTTTSDHLGRDDLLAAERQLDAAIADGTSDDAPDPEAS